MDLKSKIRNIPDFPEKGVIFRDITTLVGDAQAFHYAVDMMAQRLVPFEVDKIAVLDARGFIAGSPVAYKLEKGIVPMRKAGKLPADTYSVPYTLEYGEQQLQMHCDALTPGMRVAVIDDLLATGGTAKAACSLIEKAGAQVVALGFLIELKDLGGRGKLEGYEIFSLVEYD